MEIANIICVTKNDGDLVNAVEISVNDYKSSLKLMRSTIPNWETKVCKVSSKTEKGKVSNEF